MQGMLWRCCCCRRGRCFCVVAFRGVAYFSAAAVPVLVVVAVAVVYDTCKTSAVYVQIEWAEGATHETV